MCTDGVLFLVPALVLCGIAVSTDSKVYFSFGLSTVSFQSSAVAAIRCKSGTKQTHKAFTGLFASIHQLFNNKSFFNVNYATG